MFPFGNNMYGAQDQSYNSGDHYGFQSHSYNNYQPSYGYNQNQSFGYDQYPTEPYGYSHICQQPYDRHISEQSQGWEDSYASNMISSSVAEQTCTKMEYLHVQIEKYYEGLKKH